MDYTSEALIEKYLVITIDASYAAQVALWVTAMSRFMDKKANTILVEDTETTRKYDGDGRNTLLIDPCHTITAVESPNGTSITPLEYPANEDSKTSLVLDGSCFTQGLQNVEVTGKFGRFADIVPTDIEYACTVLASAIVYNSMNQKDDITSETVGKYSVSFKGARERADYKQALDIISSYKRIAV